MNVHKNDIIKLIVNPNAKALHIIPEKLAILKVLP
jgi:hypothetical protein